VIGTLVERIRAEGPLRFDAFMEVALYDPAGGFYAAGGRAGARSGQFLTSPEVGPLFGAVVARALDAWWEDAGRASPFVVVDAGAGPGTLARAVLAASPAVAAAGALRYVAVERAATQRAAHAGLPVTSLETLPDEPFVGVVLANELLDNLPFRLAVNDGGWREALVSVDSGARLVEVLGPFSPVPACLPPTATHGARAPVQEEAARWVSDVLARLRPPGRLVVFDYASSTAAMAAQPWREWLRTYRDHQRGGHYLAEPGAQDITSDVALDQLAPPTATSTQADFLRTHGLEELVEEGRRRWAANAAAPDLAALAARSRVREAEALTDPAGLGGFTVAEWLVT
jgi:SAM-dependent MidA family methyltransferase